MTRSRRGRALARWGLALVLLGVMAALVARRPEPILRLLHVPAELALAMALLVAVNQFLMSLRLAMAVEKCGGVRAPASSWFRLTSVAQFLNLFVPQLGNVYRAVVLKREHGITYMSYASGLIAFVWLDLIVGLVIAFTVIVALEPGLRLAGVPALLLLAALTGPVIVAPRVGVRALALLRLRSDVATRWQDRLTKLLEVASSALADRRFVLRFFGINVLVTVTHVVALRLGFSAVGATVDVSVLVLFQVFIKLANQIAITPGNIGLTELAYGVLAHASTSTLEQGIAAGLLLRLVGTAAVVVLGLLCGGSTWLFAERAQLRAELEKGKVSK